MRADCPFEHELLEHVQTRTWPARADAELRAHVAACASCRDLAVVAAALIEDRDDLAPEVEVPRGQLVWMRAQARARREAARTASRPITVAVVAAVMVATAGVSVALTTGWRWAAAFMGSVVGHLPGAPSIDVRGLASYATPELLLSPLVTSTATLAILVAAVSLYVMLSHD